MSAHSSAEADPAPKNGRQDNESSFAGRQNRERFYATLMPILRAEPAISGRW